VAGLEGPQQGRGRTLAPLGKEVDSRVGRRAARRSRAKCRSPSASDQRVRGPASRAHGRFATSPSRHSA
jgi:hypothetical protein